MEGVARAVEGFVRGGRDREGRRGRESGGDHEGGGGHEGGRGCRD